VSDFTWTGVLKYVLWSIPLLFLALFFIYPLGSILVLSLVPNGQLDLSGFAAIVASPYYLEIFAFTIFQAALSTGLTIILALPCAYVFARYRFRGKSLLLALSILPFVLPTVVVAAAFSALLGERGILNNAIVGMFNLSAHPIQLERTLAFVLLAHIFYNYPIALRIIAAYWSNQNPHVDEAAATLGIHGLRLWWRVYVPLLRPAILAAASLIFVFTFTSFGIVLILGGPRYATLEVEIYRQAVGVFNLQVAAALSLLQIGFMLIVMLVYTRLQRRINIGRNGLRAARTVARPPRTLTEKLFVTANLSFMIALLFAPLAALLVQSVTVGSQTVTLRNFALLATNPRGSVLYVPPLEAIGNSLIIAFAAMITAVLIGVIAVFVIARRSHFTGWLDPVFMLPLATSAVTLGFGFLIALDEPPVNLRSSLLILPIAHVLVAIPLVIRSVLPAKEAISPSIYEAAQSLGALPTKILREIDLPLMSRSLIVAATFAFTVSIGEFGATAFLARPENPTIPVVIYRLLGQPGAVNYGQALAMSSVLLLVCAISFLLIGRFHHISTGEF
jgi:thiamine transport system permease protein